MARSEAGATQGRADALTTLANETFDFLVIGGGITGCGIAREAALAGYRVALVERDDFASGTSSRSSRLVHGGVRYLEHGHLGMVFESSRERRLLLQLAPHLVRPLAFTWPVYAGARVPKWKLRAGLLLYDVLALFRNVQNHDALDAAGVLAHEPALATEACAYTHLTLPQNRTVLIRGGPVSVSQQQQHTKSRFRDSINIMYVS